MIPVYPLIIDSTSYVATSSEVVRNAMWEYIYSSGLPDQLMKRAYYRDQVGKDSICYWSEMFFYYDLIEYMVLMFEDIKEHGYDCDTEEFDALVATYKLDCVKKTLLCRYGASGILDHLKATFIKVLQQKLNLCCPAQAGISYMQISGNDCNVFHVYPQA